MRFAQGQRRSGSRRDRYRDTLVRRVRHAVRSARNLPVLRLAITGIDRIWWSRVIRGADIVDLEYVAAQAQPMSARAAVRRYVRGAFRDGFSLNPLFMEQLVSHQLSDAGRVPALYAYLVNDSRTVQTSTNWDAPRFGTRADAAGPLGAAWRHLLAGGLLEWGAPRATKPMDLAALRRVALEAASYASGTRRPPTLERLDGDAVVILLHERERDLARAIQAGVTASRSLDAELVYCIPPGVVDGWLAALGCKLGMPRVRVAGSIPPAQLFERLRQMAPEGARVVVRGPDDEISGEDLVALSRAPGDQVAPLVLRTDGTIASAGRVVHAGRPVPLFRGHPREDAQAIGDIIPVSAPDANSRALTVGRAGGRAVTLTVATVISDRRFETSPSSVPARDDAALEEALKANGWSIEGWTDAGPRLLREPATARPRWAIKTAAPAGLAAEWWGDTHFARGLATALRRQGQEVVIDSFHARNRPTRHLDDIELVLRGPQPIAPRADSFSILWIISHPDEITKQEVSQFDLVFAASTSWAAKASRQFGREVHPLLQCTDTSRFRPKNVRRGDRIVFVGTARGEERPSVVTPVRAGIPVDVYGPDWTGYIPASSVVASHVPNTELPTLYETASVVLNDHWPAMRREGFISNRLFDVVAANGRAISDFVTGIDEIFGGSVQTYNTIEELLRLLRHPLDPVFPDVERQRANSARIRAEHSFDARAHTLIEAASAARGVR